jgi:lysophospholipase L1-like esterase
MFNMVLQQRISDRPNAIVADWFTVASAPDQHVLRSDDLHPNTDGQAVLSMLVLQALQRL